jgi:hypothetical protein
LNLTEKRFLSSRWGAVLAGNRFFQEIISGGKRVPEQHQFLTLWHQNSFYLLADESKIHLFPEQALNFDYSIRIVLDVSQ